ncbi:MAG: tetratricopeptide repeat protein, partial [Gammaproteobacteria bacterium]|nr:tetratricopeptide repeat protein [Gammaproteobacteria bacterium]
SAAVTSNVPAAASANVSAAAVQPVSAQFSFSVHTSPGSEPVIHRGEPLLAEVLLILTGEETVRIALESGEPWTGALSLVLEDGSGKAVAVDWAGLEQAGTELEFSASATEIRAVAGLSPEQLGALTPGNYRLTAAFDTRDSAAHGAWTGKLSAAAVPVTVSGEVNDKDEPVFRLRSLARWHLLNDRPEEALAQLDAALAHAPGDVEVLSDKSDVLVELNRNDEAVAVLQQALSQYYRSSPDASHPPRWLLHRLRDLETFPVADAETPLASADGAEAAAQTTPSAPAHPAVAATTLQTERAATGVSYWVGDRAAGPADSAGQWAADALAGSQYSEVERSAQRATGAPDVPGVDDHPNAWCPAQRDSGSDWLELGFERAAPATEVRVRQSYGPGAIVKVEAIEPGGQAHTWWEGIDPFGQDGFAEDAVWFSVRVPATPYDVQKIRLTVNLGAHGRWKQIDAVQLIGAMPR